MTNVGVSFPRKWESINFAPLSFGFPFTREWQMLACHSHASGSLLTLPHFF